MNADEALARRHTVRELVSAYQDAVAAIRTAFGMLVAAEEHLNARCALGETHSRIHIRSSRSSHADSFDEPNEAIDSVRRQVWGTIVERLELNRVLTGRRKRELDEQLDRGELPEITEATVAQFAREWGEMLPEAFNEMVRSAFEYMRPREHTKRGYYKTNSKLEIGPKVVLTSIVEGAWLKPGFRVRYSYSSELSELERVFQGLDGAGTISKAYYSELENAINASGADGTGETKYFRFRCFKNGNLHVEFLRRDLLAKLNQVAGGKHLRPAA